MVVEQPRADSRSCLSLREVEALAAGSLTAESRGLLLRHVAGCEHCRGVLQVVGYNEVATASEPRSTTDTGIEPARVMQPSDMPTEQQPLGQQQPLPAAVPLERTALAGKYPYLAAPQSTDEIGRLGQYRILRVLGEGGMGTVFEAEDSLLHRRVAVKVLRPYGLDESSRQRFLQEARLAASLASDRIVTIYQIGEDRGCPYLVMELLPGESLETRLKRDKRLPLAAALQITREVAEGLAVAHAKGLIHRDIKPANVWLESGRSGDREFRVKILDFGIARQIVSDQRLTAEGLIVGTPGYLCPEQACGLPLDGRSDLFSLGCLLYAMLVGESPFKRANTMLSIRAVAEEELPPVRGKLPELPQPVADLLDRLLARFPADRPETATQVVHELRSLEHAATAATPLHIKVPTAVLGHRIPAMTRLGWSSVAGALAVMLAAAIGLWVQYDRFAGAPPPTTNEVPGSGPATPAAASVAEQPAAPAAVPLSPALPPIKVGILHSFSGPLAASEGPVADATQLAIDEINAAGGLLGGRQIESIRRDGKSYADSFAQQADELISQERVVTLFGVWRSGARKAVEEVCRRYNHLLVYPRGHEGLEQSANVIYMGGAPNQQTTPAVRWAYADLRKRKFFLVGTEGVFSYASNAIIKDELNVLGGTVAGEEYRLLGDHDFTAVADKILQSGADVVMNTVSGTSNIGLFVCLHKAGIDVNNVPVFSYDITEEELRTLSATGDDLAGNYACWSYFQSINTPENREFIRRFRQRFGQTRNVNDPMAAAYAGVHLWALGVQAAGSDRVADIRRAMVRQRFQAPEGLVSIDPENQYAVRMARIGEVDKHLEFDVVWTSPKPIVPEPFPPTRTRAAWEEFIQSLRQRWGGQWAPDALSPKSTPSPKSLPSPKSTP